MGRPKIEIDAMIVEKLANCNSTDEEIAAKVGCSAKTLTNRFSDLLKKGRADGKNMIRAAQFEVGVKRKNVTMLIWLGKQLLGQTDHAEITDGDVSITFRTQTGPPETLRKKGRAARRKVAADVAASDSAEGETE